MFKKGYFLTGIRRSTEEVFQIQEHNNQKNFYQTLYGNHAFDLQNYLRKRLPSSEVLDACHDVFLKVLNQNSPEKLENFPKAYLFKIADNHIKDLYRRNKTRQREKHVPIQDIEEYAISCHENLPDKNLDSQQKLEHLKQGLKTMKPKYRDILLLYLFEQKSHKEIAEYTGHSLSTVYRYMEKALEFLQAYSR